MSFAQCLLRLSLLLLLPLVSACSFQAQQVTVNPELNFNVARVGQGQKVFIELQDERPSDILGYRQNLLGQAAAIRTSPSTQQNLLALLKQGFEQAGFRIQPFYTDDTKLVRISLRELSYKADPKVLNHEVRMQVTLKVRAESGSRYHDSTYRSENVEGLALSASPGRNDIIVNEALEDTVQRLLKDPALIQFLNAY